MTAGCGVDALYLRRVLPIERERIDGFDIEENRTERVASKHVRFDMLELDLEELRTVALRTDRKQPHRSVHGIDFQSLDVVVVN